MWEMQLWMQTKQKTGENRTEFHRLSSKQPWLKGCCLCLGSFFFCWSQLSSSRLLLTQTNRRQAAQLVTGQGRVGASKLLRSTNTQSWCEEMRKIHGPSLQALLSFLSSPPRYQMQCLFLQRWSRRPIWMCRSGPHLLSLSFTAWYLPSVKPAGGWSLMCRQPLIRQGQTNPDEREEGKYHSFCLQMASDSIWYIESHIFMLKWWDVPKYHTAA